MSNPTSPAMKKYFESINNEVESAYLIANEARSKGLDPEDKVDIPLAHNMAERVGGLISTVAPNLLDGNLIHAIHDYEKKYSPSDWRVAFEIAVDVANQKFCNFESKKEAMEVGIRVGFSYITGGIVSAPLEGFIELRIKKRKDGKEYFAPSYAGPIRGAGGTAAAVSVIITDYVRCKMGYSKYDPTDEEINRQVTEIYDYHERCVNLQYLPSRDELIFLLKNLPVELDGDATEKLEVSNYKDMPRIETNHIRGGMCLVIAEGVAQKSKKLWKRLKEWGSTVEIDWLFLSEFLDLQKRIKGNLTLSSNAKVSPDHTFMSDMVAGRPILTYPMKIGGFRLRYGRSRLTGFSAAAIHPATMHILDKYVATGTQLKVERPGKAAAITPCDSIEAPIVKLKDESVVIVKNEKHAKEIVNDVKEVIFLGDILFNYGDFFENNQVLAPCGYSVEQWHAELKALAEEKYKSKPLETLSSIVDIPVNYLELNSKNIFNDTLNYFDNLKISKELGLPIHPKNIYYWRAISPEQLIKILTWSLRANIIDNGGKITKIILPHSPDAKRNLELAGVPHLFVNKEFTIIEKEHAAAIALQLNLTDKENLKKIIGNDISNDTTLSIINKLSELEVRDKCGTFVGARMGRPEKAKQRKMAGSPQVLFPVGDEGGRLRSFQSSLEKGKVTADFPIYYCSACNAQTVYRKCHRCTTICTKKFHCRLCGILENPECPKHGQVRDYQNYSIDINEYFSNALGILRTKSYPDLIKGVRGTSNKDHIPENLVKGILRSKYLLYVNKDGTIRFDMSELPITHFKPSEIFTSVEKLKKLGYTTDIDGIELTQSDQLLEIKPQDIIIPGSKDAMDEQGDVVLLRVANFVDELLEKFYNLKPFYNVSTRNDLVGQLVIGLAPHISAGTIGRIIGFSDTQAFFAHPFFHAAMRRDADGDEACVILLMDGLLNFSRKFLPNKRGSKTMDSPLVLTSSITASEIDDQAHGIDVVWQYSLDFYTASKNCLMANQINIEQIRHRLGKPGQYEGIGFTHPVSSINQGIKCSAYKGLPSMEEKLDGQMKIARKVNAVDPSDVARLVIEKHFIKDTRGNLRKFSMQQFRCVNCNEKYRRPPLVGHCTQCGERLIFTIAQGSVVKYLGYSINLAEQYNVPAYLKQTLEILKRMVEDNFGREKERQEGLSKWTLSTLKHQ